MRILIVPGLNGSGPGHWQTLWEEKYNGKRVNQRDWSHPDVTEWLQTLDTVITRHQERAVIVAHSLGCHAVALWSQTYSANTNHVQCALLVAPPDMESSENIPESMRLFASHAVIPFPSVVVGSDNDPFMTVSAVRRLSRLWGSQFINAGFAGHINVDSGHGHWRDGEEILKILIEATT